MLPPAFLVLISGIHVLGANGAAVSLAQRVHELSQTHGVFAKKGVAGVEHCLLIGVTETVKSRLQLRNLVPLGTLERIKISPAGTDIAVGGDKLLHRCALTAHFGICARPHHLRPALFGTLGERIDHWQVGHVFGAGAVASGNMLKRIKVITPSLGNTARVGKVVLVHLFHVGRIATKKIGAGLVGLVSGRGHRGRWPV